MSKIELDTNHANKATIYFGSGIPFRLIDIVQVFTFVGTINFHVVNPPTPFLLCLKNMDKLSIYLNNITNQFICQNGKNISVFLQIGTFLVLYSQK